MSKNNGYRWLGSLLLWIGTPIFVFGLAMLVQSFECNGFCGGASLLFASALPIGAVMMFFGIKLIN